MEGDLSGISWQRPLGWSRLYITGGITGICFPWPISAAFPQQPGECLPWPTWGSVSWRRVGGCVTRQTRTAWKKYKETRGENRDTLSATWAKSVNKVGGWITIHSYTIWIIVNKSYNGIKKIKAPVCCARRAGESRSPFVLPSTQILRF